MPDAKSRFVERILDSKTASNDDHKAFTSERQHTAQALGLHVEWREGRFSEGFSWAHYSGYRWSDEGDHEKLVVGFGARAVEIEGHNLGVLVSEIREGRLNCIRELSNPQCALLRQSNPDNEPITTRVKAYPDFEEVLRVLKGEEDDKHRDARRFER